MGKKCDIHAKTQWFHFANQSYSSGVQDMRYVNFTLAANKSKTVATTLLLCAIKIK